MTLQLKKEFDSKAQQFDDKIAFFAYKGNVTYKIDGIKIVLQQSNLNIFPNFIFC